MATGEEVQGNEPGDAPKKATKSGPKKPAFITQVKMLKAEAILVAEAHAKLVGELSETIASANAALANKAAQIEALTNQQSEHISSIAALKDEIEQVHSLCDLLPGTAGRKTTPEESWNAKDIKLMTRLATYLASRSIPATPAAI